MGTLDQYGYSLQKSPRERRDALVDAVLRNDWITVVRKLIAVSELSTHPGNIQKYREDIQWIREIFGPRRRRRSRS